MGKDQVFFIGAIKKWFSSEIPNLTSSFSSIVNILKFEQEFLYLLSKALFF